MISLIFALLMSQASIAKSFECYGIVYNHTSKQMDKQALKQASFDKDFYEVTIKNYALWADTFSMKDMDDLTMGLIEKKTDTRSASTAGWKVINKTRTQDLRFYFKLPDGSQDEVQINCYDYL